MRKVMRINPQVAKFAIPFLLQISIGHFALFVFFTIRYWIRTQRKEGKKLCSTMVLRHNLLVFAQ